MESKSKKTLPLVETFHRYGAKMLKNFPDKNFVFSPFISQTALTMCYLGAKGKTAIEMADAMNYSDSLDLLAEYRSVFELSNRQSSKIKVYGMMLIKDSFKLIESYQNTIKKNFQMVSTEMMDFNDEQTCVDRINSWVAEKTEDNIRAIIESFDADPLKRMVLINVIYFEAEWANRFKALFTSGEPFWTSPTQTFNAAMMTRTDYEKFANIPELDSKVLELSYKGTEAKMMFILPNEKLYDAKKLKMKLSEMQIEKIVHSLADTYVAIKLPKFKFEYQFDEKKVLQAMGVNEAFNQVKADFTGMNDSKEPLWISSIMHQAFIEVGEWGTKAGAVALVRVRGGGAGPVLPEPVEFIADHPFAFIIRLGAISFFQGVVADGKALVEYVKPDLSNILNVPRD